MRKMKSVLSAIVFMFAVGCLVADDVFECEFKPGKWNKNDFICVKSSRWPNINSFKQEANHIVNSCPADATKEDKKRSVKKEEKKETKSESRSSRSGAKEKKVKKPKPQKSSSSSGPVRSVRRTK